MPWPSAYFQCDAYQAYHHQYPLVDLPQPQAQPFVHMNVRENTGRDVPPSTEGAYGTSAGIQHHISNSGPSYLPTNTATVLSHHLSPLFPPMQLSRQATHGQNIDNREVHRQIRSGWRHADSRITNEDTRRPQQAPGGHTTYPTRCPCVDCRYPGSFQAESSLIRDLGNLHFPAGPHPCPIQDCDMVSIPRAQLAVLVAEARRHSTNQTSNQLEPDPEAVVLGNVEQVPGTKTPRPASRGNFEIAIICALTVEQDAVHTLFDHYWDDNGPPYDKHPGDPNAYSYGAIGRHNIVLAHMPGMGKASAAAVAAYCRVSFPNLKLALIVGVCGALPFMNTGQEVILGDVIIGDGIIQYDFGRLYPGQFVSKNTLLDSLGRPNLEIRAHLAKLKSRRGRTLLRRMMDTHLRFLQSDPQLKTDYQYPGTEQDVLYKPESNVIVSRRRLEQANPRPDVHFGLIASGDMLIKDGKRRDTIAMTEGVIAFEMEGAGVSDNIPHVVIKGVSDYADSHKTKAWQPYAAGTAAACMKAFLQTWVPAGRSC